MQSIAPTTLTIILMCLKEMIWWAVPLYWFNCIFSVLLFFCVTKCVGLGSAFYMSLHKSYFVLFSASFWCILVRMALRWQTNELAGLVAKTIKCCPLTVKIMITLIHTTITYVHTVLHYIQCHIYQGNWDICRFGITLYLLWDVRWVFSASLPG